MPEKYLIMAIIMVIGGLIVAACFVIYAVMRLESKIEDTFLDIMSLTMRYIEDSVHEVNNTLNDIKADIIAKGSKGDDIDSDDYKERVNNTFNKVHDQILALQNSFEFRDAHNENKFSETDDKIDKIEDRIDDIENKLHYTVNSTAFSSMDQLLEERND